MKRTSGESIQIHQSGVLGELANHGSRMGRLRQVEKSIGEIDRGEITPHGNR
jgi:hypothetical protein